MDWRFPPSVHPSSLFHTSTDVARDQFYAVTRNLTPPGAHAPHDITHHSLTYRVQLASHPHTVRPNQPVGRPCPMPPP